MNAANRGKLAEEIARRLAAALRGAQLYAADHPIVKRNAAALVEIGQQRARRLPHPHHRHRRSGPGDRRLADPARGRDDGRTDAPAAAGGHRAHRHRERRRARRDHGTGAGRRQGRSRPDGRAQHAQLPHIRVGKLQVDQKVGSSIGDMSRRSSSCTRTPSASPNASGTARPSRASPTPTPPTAWWIHWPRPWRRIERRCSR